MTTTFLERCFGLTGKVAVVTGGAIGIGAGIAKTLAGAGAKVIVADRDAAAAETHAQALRDQGWDAASATIDVADEASVVTGVGAIVAAHGAPWVLVNNAGVQNRQLLLETEVAYWDHTHAVNARGVMLMLREVGKAMVEAKRGGRIVNISSLGVRHPTLLGLATYTASKAAVVGLTQNAALELAPHQITVNAVLPGGVLTSGGINATGPRPTGALRQNPLGQCEPEDMGAAVLFLASPAARFVTNQALAVDAGFLLT